MLDYDCGHCFFAVVVEKWQLCEVLLEKAEIFQHFLVVLPVA